MCRSSSKSVYLYVTFIIYKVTLHNGVVWQVLFLYWDTTPHPPRHTTTIFVRAKPSHAVNYAQCHLDNLWLPHWILISCRKSCLCFIFVMSWYKLCLCSIRFLDPKNICRLWHQHLSNGWATSYERMICIYIIGYPFLNFWKQKTVFFSVVKMNTG